MSISVPSESVWLSGRQARLRGGLTATALLELAALGRVRTRALAGEPIKYSAADIERIVGAQQVFWDAEDHCTVPG
jgi:hypothetical protein